MPARADWVILTAWGIVIVAAAVFWIAVLSSPSHGATYQAPPAIYDHEPTTPYEVRYRTAHLFELYCGTNHPKVGGCTRIAAGTCFVTIREELGQRDKGLVLAHERAHCNGWPSSHPRLR